MDGEGYRELHAWLQGPAGDYLLYALAGLAGAVVNCVLEQRPVVLPRLVENRLELGFLGNLAACTVVAQIADHSFQSAFFASLGAVLVLRHLKRRLEAAFETEWERLKRGEGE